MRLIVTIPAYNEEKHIVSVLSDLKKVCKDIIVVDDGSTDDTYRLASEQNVSVCRHIINRGLGGAIGTGIAAALKKGAEIIVTFDADGQHIASDVPRMIAPIEKGECDVVIGSRMISQDKGMSMLRKIYNRVGNIVTFLLFGIKVTDSQSGLRAFSSRAASLMKLRANRMEVSSEIIREIKTNHLTYREIPIKPIYTKYSLSKGQNFFVGFKTLIKLIVIRILK